MGRRNSKSLVVAALLVPSGLAFSLAGNPTGGTVLRWGLVNPSLFQRGDTATHTYCISPLYPPKNIRILMLMLRGLENLPLAIVCSMSRYPGTVVGLMTSCLDCCSYLSRSTTSAIR